MAFKSYQAKVVKVEHYVNIRSGPGTNYKDIGNLNKGTVVTVIDKNKDGKWSKIATDKWVSSYYLQATSSPNTSSSTNGKTTATQKAKAKTAPPVKINMQAAKQLLTVKNSVNVHENRPLRGLYGMPFSPNFYADVPPTMDTVRQADGTMGLKQSVDPRDFRYGRRFSETFITDAPVVALFPGRPKFLPSVDKNKKNAVLKAFSNQKNSVIEEIMNGKDARWYSWESDYAEYYKYVNSLCRVAAVYFFTEPGSKALLKKYSTKDWANEKSDTLNKLTMSKSESVAFYVETTSAMSEGGSNSSDKSMVDNQLSSASDLMKEAQFLLGGVNPNAMNKLSKDNYNEQITDISKKISGSSNPAGLLSKLSTGTQTITSAGNILFPQIWKNSDWSKNYSLDLRFYSPYGDKESVYLNVIVPLMHVMALSFPRQIHANGYVTPFLIRAFSKGWFNIDMGMIDSITVKKGGNGDMWSVDGVPLEIEVNIQLKDMYSVLAISNDTNNIILNNVGMLDFIATMAGVNISGPDMEKRLVTALMKIYNVVPDTTNNVSRSLSEKILNVTNQYLGFRK